MTAAHERLVNLALYLASRARPVTIQQCREAGLGYPDDADDAAFQRMFERDKDALRAAGIAIVVDEEGRYSIDAAQSFAAEVDLTDAECAEVRVLAAALVNDPSFPFGDDLALAVAKMDLGPFPDEPARSTLALEDPERQSSLARAAADAVARRKRVRFAYTNARGESKFHEVEPYGLAFRRGRWYLVGRDVAIGEVRIYALVRASGLEVNAASPKNPDFEPPAGFRIEDCLVLPFQIGSDRVQGSARFEPDAAWRAAHLTEGKGRLNADADGGLRWEVEIASPRAFASWCIANGPGIVPLAPASAVRAYRVGLEEVAARHE
ncbi:WYL domain-containing protein [Coriobacteriia bacterium Es71-Z0120]|uniref:helix-turn-helix transcriptional regulator n=1 Tax=Parvivirga hydrogeniphila TaxID=2939460 RepID=UPI002260FBD3|nr:WYL domain-containing protein [Parvivirga hydrogeniphila]MCL4078164.1 WYL domain-containing protein [Parvivirga hydrogeniphila]